MYAVRILLLSIVLFFQQSCKDDKDDPTPEADTTGPALTVSGVTDGATLVMENADYQPGTVIITEILITNGRQEMISFPSITRAGTWKPSNSRVSGDDTTPVEDQTATVTFDEVPTPR